MLCERLPSGNGRKTMIILESFLCLILNVRTHIVHIHTVLEGFAYPCETWYADFVRVYGTTHLEVSVLLSVQHNS